MSNTAGTAAQTQDFTLDDLLLRIIEKGQGSVAVPVVENAVVTLLTHGDEQGGFELEDLLAYLRAINESQVAAWVAEAAADLQALGAPLTALNPVWDEPEAEAGPNAPGYFREMKPGKDDTEAPRRVIAERIAQPLYAGAAPAVGRHAFTGDDPGLRAEAEKVKWFHSYDFGGGIRTEGKKPLDILRREADIIFHYDVQGRSVLDIGAWDGFFSVQAATRGAGRVLSTDYFCWGGPGWGTKRGFDLARRVLAPSLEEKEIDVPDLSPETVGQFDVVLFLGVLYHLPHPLRDLERISRVCKDMLVLETQMDLLDVDRPAMAFYPGSELNGDPTNWCGPNVPCVVGMLETVGFREIYYTTHPDAPSRGIFHALK